MRSGSSPAPSAVRGRSGGGRSFSRIARRDHLRRAATPSQPPPHRGRCGGGAAQLWQSDSPIGSFTRGRGATPIQLAVDVRTRGPWRVDLAVRCVRRLAAMGPLVLALLALPGADAVAQDRPPPAARVSLDASPEATVQVDDAVELETPVDIKLLRPGRHSFTFRRWGFYPKTVELDLRGRPARVNVALEPTMGRTLLAFGYAVAFGYSGVGLTPRGREAGIASRWAHGAAFSLSGQAFHL